MSLFRFAAAATLAASLLTPAAAQAPAQLAVNVWSYGFAPRPIHLRAGQPVTLTFVNRSGAGHDFTAPRFFANATVTSGAAPQGEIELAPHQTVSVTLVPRAGTYKAHCSHFFHKQLGMRDVIVVD